MATRRWVTLFSICDKGTAGLLGAWRASGQTGCSRAGREPTGRWTAGWNHGIEALNREARREKQGNSHSAFSGPHCHSTCPSLQSRAAAYRAQAISTAAGYSAGGPARRRASVAAWGGEGQRPAS